MKRVGLLDNLVDIQTYVESRMHQSSAKDLMAATGGNTGNVAFVFGVRKLLANPIRRVAWGSNPDIIRQQVDQLVICCANQIGAHVDLAGWADRLAQFGLPVTLIGLGAQSNDYATIPVVPEGTQRWLKMVQTMRPNPDCSNVSVRGDFTRSVLATLGVESVPTGCPSLMISSRKQLGAELLARQAAHPVERVAVAAGNPWHGPSAFLESRLVDIVDKWRGAYVLQHPQLMFQLALGERSQMEPAHMARLIEIYQGRFDEDAMERWYQLNAHFFADVPNWMRFYEHFDRVLGPRYHGVALAVQAGVPGTVFAIDSRTRELSEETGVKCLDLSALKDAGPDDLIKLSEWSAADAQRLDQTRVRKQAEFVEFLTNNGLQPSPHLLGLAE